MIEGFLALLKINLSDESLDLPHHLLAELPSGVGKARCQINTAKSLTKAIRLFIKN